MPHLIVEYSIGVLPDDTLDDTLLALNEAVVGSGSLQKESDLKSRLVQQAAWRVGTETAERGFVVAQLRILPGRTPEMRAELAQRIAGVLREKCRRNEGAKLQLSVEIIEMARDSYIKETL